MVDDEIIRLVVVVEYILGLPKIIKEGNGKCLQLTCRNNNFNYKITSRLFPVVSTVHAERLFYIFLSTII